MSTSTTPGRPSRQQRAWAGVLGALAGRPFCRESARHAESARQAETGRPDEPIHVAVDHSRRVVAPPGVCVHRTVPAERAGVVEPQSTPAALRGRRAGRGGRSPRSDFAAFGVLAEACRYAPDDAPAAGRHAGEAVPAGPPGVAVGSAQPTWPRGRPRSWSADTPRPERPHGLPRAERQVRASASCGVVYRDVEYAAGLVVELDGRLVHNTVPQRDADFERDSTPRRSGSPRCGCPGGRSWDRPCATALKIALLLQLPRLDRAHPARAPPAARSTPGEREDPSHLVKRILPATGSRGGGADSGEVVGAHGGGRGGAPGTGSRRSPPRRAPAAPRCCR